AVRPGSAWRAQHPAGPPPQQPRTLFPFPFSMEARPGRMALMTVPVQAGRRDRLTLPVHVRNYRGRLHLEGRFLSAVFPLPENTKGLEPVEVSVYATEPETTEIMVSLEGESADPSVPSYLWVSPPTLSHDDADDLPVRVRP